VYHQGDSKFYSAEVGAHVSLTIGSNPSVDDAIASYPGEDCLPTPLCLVIGLLGARVRTNVDR